MSFVADHYLLFKALHIIAVISWVAGLLYLPRLYVYHADCTAGSEASEMLKIMERKLLNYIMKPAALLVFLSGAMLLSIPGIMEQGWIHVKLGLLIFMFGFHGACVRWQKDFAADRNTKSSRFFRYANEFPTVFMIVIVLLAVTKPF